ncbi:hypothetical protein ACV229_27140 [Burkholderia sp. MR1-5-21]
MSTKSHPSLGITRREFLHAGLCVTGAALLAPALTALVAGTPLVPASPALAADTPCLPLYKVVYDERFGASREFAHQVRDRGVPVRAIDGNVHDLWYEDLSLQWRTAPVAIAGMTSLESMFVLAMMAQDVRLRVIYRAHHVVGDTHGGDAKGAATHSVYGPLAALAQQPVLAGTQAQWARTAAHIVTAWPKSAVSRSPQVSTILRAGDAAVERTSLVTWVIAPDAASA